jgi:obg-like ATPase 1
MRLNVHIYIHTYIHTFDIQLITAKEVIYLVNESSRDYLRKRTTVAQHAVKDFVCRSDLGDVTAEVLPISLEFEEQYYHIERFEDIDEYAQANPTHVPVIPKIIKTCYRTLGLHHFYMASENEVKCFGISHGTTIKDASALIDVEIYRKFIRGDVVQWDDYFSLQGDKVMLQLEGKWKSEAKKYVVGNGDIVEFFWHQGKGKHHK